MDSPGKNEALHGSIMFCLGKNGGATRVFTSKLGLKSEANPDCLGKKRNSIRISVCGTWINCPT